MPFTYFLIEIDFDTRSYFPPANQKAHLKTHNQSKFEWCHTRVYTLSFKRTY